MPLRLNEVHFTPKTKTAASKASIGKDQARTQLLEMAVSLVSGGSPKSGFLRLSLQKGQPYLAHGRMGSGYTAAGELVKDLLHKAYGSDLVAVQQFERYLHGRGKVGVKSFLQLLGHLEPGQLGAQPELNGLNLNRMGGRLRLILKQDGPQAPLPGGAPPVYISPDKQASALKPEVPPWSPAKTLTLSRQALLAPGVLAPPTRPQTGSHALNTQAFAAFQKAGVAFGLSGLAAGDSLKQGKITIDGQVFDYSAKATVAKGSGAGIWMIGLKGPGGTQTEFVIKANPPKRGEPGDGPEMAAFYALSGEKDLTEVQVLDLMSGNAHALQFHGAYAMPDGTLIYGMEKAAGDMLSVAEDRKAAALGKQLVHRAEDTHLLEAARGLADLHACGQVHGDIKSDNFMLGIDGKVRIADFGESHKTSENQRKVGLQDDVRRFAAMACRIRYGLEISVEKVASTLQARQQELELDVTLQLSQAIAAHQGLFNELSNAPNADSQMIASVGNRLARLMNASTATEALLEASGDDLQESVSDYAFNQLMLEAATTAAPNFDYMASLSQRLGRLVPGAQAQARSGSIQTGNLDEPQKGMPAAPPQRDVSGAMLLENRKGVKKLALDGQTGWYKPSNRPLNSPPKCIGMGIIDASQAIGASEATARLPEREVAASIVARLLIPHMAVGAELAKDARSSGVLLENVTGQSAAESVNWQANPVKMRTQVYDAIKSQLSDLQAFDYLIGNVDRHLENYIIDGETVRAIDNDLSFPTVPVDKLVTVPDSKFGGLPAGYSSQLRQGLTRINTGQLAREIKPLIGDKAYAQLLDRLDRLIKDVFSAGKAATPAEPSSPFLTGLA